MSVASTNQVWALRGLKDYQRLTLMAFADWANPEGMAWFTLPTLAAKLDVNESTARRHRDWAISKGHLKIVKQVNGRGGKTYYQLTLNGSSSEPQERAPGAPAAGREKGGTSSEKGSIAVPPFSAEEAATKGGEKGINFDKKGGNFEQIPSHARRERYKQPIGIGGNTPPSQPSDHVREPLAEKASINGEAEALLIAAEVRKPKAAQLAAAYPLEKIRLQEEQYRADLATGADIGPGALAWRIENNYAAPVKAQSPARSYQPEDYREAAAAPPRYSVGAAEGVRADEYRRHEEAPAAAPPAVPAPAPPLVQSPEATLEVALPMDVPPLGDDWDSVWERCQHDFLYQNPQAADWLKGSVLEATDELEDGKPVFNIVVAGRKQLDWLNAHNFAIRRSLSVEMKRSVVVKVVTPEAMAVSALTRELAVAA